MRNFLISIVVRMLLQPFKLLRIKKKRVLFVSYRGKQYSCNPRYISEALECSQLELGWAFHEPDKFRFLEDRGITVLSDRSLKFIIWAMTARVIVTNTYYKPFIPRRKGQFFLRTWHGGGAYKKVDYPKGLKGAYIRMQQQGANLYLSSSKAFTRMTLQGSFGYTGDVMEAGMPRNDMLLDPIRRAGAAQKARAALGIPETAKVCLYAPTWREGREDEDFALDVMRLRLALEVRFGGQYVIIYRGHHTLDGRTNVSGYYVDATDYPDMQELLCLSKVLVTDYSSCIWDMSLMCKPVFLYCTDLKKYRAERDFYTDIKTWPFPLAKNNDELENRILNFDVENFTAAVEMHLNKLGCCETGRASEKCAERILDICGADPWTES